MSKKEIEAKIALYEDVIKEVKIRIKRVEEIIYKLSAYCDDYRISADETMEMLRREKNMEYATLTSYQDSIKRAKKALKLIEKVEALDVK